MRRPTFLLAALAFALTGPPAAGHEADPFALLFGEDEVDASAEARAGDDDLSLVSLALRDLELVDSIAAYETSTGLCLPLAPLMEALAFPIRVENALAEGWFITPDRNLRLDFETGDAVVAGRPVQLAADAAIESASGWCVSLGTLSKLFPITFTYDMRNLAIVATPRELLPIEAQLERAARREALDRNADPELADYRAVGNPYRWLAWPVVDIDLGATRTGVALQGRYALDAAGDLLKTTARLRAAGGGVRGLDQLRLRLERTNIERKELGPLKARRFALGDIASAALPLLADADIGRGIEISSKRPQTPDLFDITEIRGPLPNDWEAELYENGDLIAFVTEPDPNGDYVFDAVPLKPGLNVFEVRLFGPFGETETRLLRYFIGSELNPENEITYTLGVIDPERSLLGVDDDLQGTDADETDRLFADLGTGAGERGGARAYASLERGLGERASVRLDAVAGIEDGRESGAAASAFLTWGGAFGAVRIATNGHGAPGFEALAQRRVGRRSSLSARFTEFGELENGFTGFDGARLARSGAVRFDTAFLLRGRSLPTQVASRWRRFASGLSTFDATARTGLAIGRTNLSHALRYGETRDSGRTTRLLTGDLLASRTVRGVRFRGGLRYGVSDRFGLQNVSVTAQKRFERWGTALFALSHDVDAGNVSASASWSRPFGPAILSTTTAYRGAGDWTAGLNLSFALFKPRSGGVVGLGPPGLSRSGSIRTIAFEDVDGDRLFGADDRAVQDVQFIVQNSLRREATGPDGAVVIGGLAAGASLNVELRTSSLEDPFLTPAELGRSIAVRPGQVIDVPFPLLATGDAEGHLRVRNGAFLTAVSGVPVQAVDGAGRVVGETRTEYDGYFYLEGLPLGDYTLRVAPDALDRVGGTAAAAPFELTTDAPSAFGVDLVVVPGEPAS